jgi:hypothetical protein
MASKADNVKRMKLISGEAKKLYNGGNGSVKKWCDAIKKASDNLKKAGKL